MNIEEEIAEENKKILFNQALYFGQLAVNAASKGWFDDVATLLDKAKLSINEAKTTDELKKAIELQILKAINKAIPIGKHHD